MEEPKFKSTSDSKAYAHYPQDVSHLEGIKDVKVIITLSKPF